MTDEEKEIIKEIDNKLDKTSADEITINLLYQKVDILENIIKENECVIETGAHNEEVLLEAIEKKDKIIDRMANEIYIEHNPHFKTTEEVKEYFEKEEE